VALQVGLALQIWLKKSGPLSPYHGRPYYACNQRKSLRRRFHQKTGWADAITGRNRALFFSEMDH